MSAKAESRGKLVDQRLVKALGHPLRQRILLELRDDEASPRRLAEALGEPLGNVSYHVKILAECEAIELARTEPVRGAVEHFYRATALPRLDEAEWKQLNPSARRAVLDGTLTQIWDDVVAAWNAGGFEDTKTSVGWIPLELDDQAYARLLEEIEAFTDRALALQADAADRLEQQSPQRGAEHSTELVLMHFHRNPSPGPGSRRRG